MQPHPQTPHLVAQPPVLSKRPVLRGAAPHQRLGHHLAVELQRGGGVAAREGDVRQAPAGVARGCRSVVAGVGKGLRFEQEWGLGSGGSRPAAAKQLESGKRPSATRNSPLHPKAPSQRSPWDRKDDATPQHAHAAPTHLMAWCLMLTGGSPTSPKETSPSLTRAASRENTLPASSTCPHLDMALGFGCGWRSGCVVWGGSTSCTFQQDVSSRAAHPTPKSTHPQKQNSRSPKPPRPKTKTRPERAPLRPAG